MSKIKGYFIENEIYYQGKKQEPRRNNVILVGDNPSFDIDNYSDNDDISVLSEDNNWYTIKKSELVLV